MKKSPNSQKSVKDLPTIHLIGDAEENFYQLGLKDAELGKKLHTDAMTLVKSNSASFDKLIKLGAREFVKRSLFQKPERFPLLRAYAEGMKIDFHDLCLVMMAPELASSLPHWLGELTPKFSNLVPPKLLGCSSLFYRNNEGEMNHFRILDFPLKGTYDENERAILYEFKNWPKIFSTGSAGIPYPSITLTTEHGISMAMHQKFTKVFNLKGMPIFEYVTDFARMVKTPDEAIAYAREHQSFTTWCLNIGFKNGEVLSMDLMGEKVEIARQSIDDPKTPFIYFNNQLLDKGIAQEELLPFGFKYYNEMREESALEKILVLKNAKDNNVLSSKEATRILCTPKHLLNKSKKTNHQNSQPWAMDILTPSSLQIMNFNLAKSQVHYIGGQAPKIYHNNMLLIDNIFRRPEITLIHDKASKSHPQDREYELALEEIMLAQKALDYHEYGNTYHHLQMAIDHFNESGDPKGSEVVKFFFILIQFLHEDHHKVRKHLRDELQILKGKLPHYLEDHRLLFLARLNRLLDGHFNIEEDNITHSSLRKLLDKESQIPNLIYYQSIKNMIVIRLDMMDVIYLHSAS